jgi:eukaryotic-like serine/threonine-protein kinase
LVLANPISTYQRLSFFCVSSMIPNLDKSDSAVIGNMEKAEEICELWTQTYPRALVPRGFLSGFIYPPMGQYEKAAQQAREGVSIDPSFPIFYANLIFGDVALDRLNDGRATYKQALERKLDPFPFLHFALYQIAFWRSDEREMLQQLAWSDGKPGVEDWLLDLEANTAAYSGRLREAQELTRRAVDSAERADKKETAATYSAVSGLREALFGNADEARRVTSALGRGPGRDVEYLAALALAYAGSKGLQTITDDLDKHYPEATIVKFNYLPTLRAKLAINRGNFSEALEDIGTAQRFELGKASASNVWMAMYPVYVRGEAYLAAHQASSAAVEFQRIVDHRGIVLNEPIGALAHLQLGRAYAMAGDTAKAKAAYQDFITLWKDADPDIPILKEAKLEYGKLQ